MPSQSAERVSFYDEQAHRRRHARWWAMLLHPAAVLTGLPLAAVLTPLVFTLLILVLRVADLTVGIPDTVWLSLRRLIGTVPAALDAFFNGSLAALATEEAVLALVVLLTPGLVVTLLLHLLVLRTLARVGTEAERRRLGAREPRLDDLEERQLVNVVEEVAVAAGVSAPAVWVLDDPEPHAALLGSDARDATVVVSRGVLDTCDRAATQGIVGHLVASAVNGDPRFGRAALAVFQTQGLVFTLLDAFLGASPSAWRDLRSWARTATGGSEAEADRLARLLAAPATSVRDDGLQALFTDGLSESPATRLGHRLTRSPLLWALVTPVLLLVFCLVLFLRIQVLLVRMMVLGPLVTPVLRARRYLADAGAVALLRDPAAVAAGLEALGRASGPLPGGRRLEHRFVVGRDGETSSDEQRPLTGSAAPHPSLSRRLARLERLGARGIATGSGNEPMEDESVEASRVATGTRFRDLSLWGKVGQVLLLIVLAPILALCAYLTLLVFAAVLGLAVGGAVFFAGVVLMFLERIIGSWLSP